MSAVDVILMLLFIGAFAGFIVFVWAPNKHGTGGKRTMTIPERGKQMSDRPARDERRWRKAVESRLKRISHDISRIRRNFEPEPDLVIPAGQKVKIYAVVIADELDHIRDKLQSAEEVLAGEEVQPGLPTVVVPREIILAIRDGYLRLEEAFEAAEMAAEESG